MELLEVKTGLAEVAGAAVKGHSPGLIVKVAPKETAKAIRCGRRRPK